MKKVIASLALMSTLTSSIYAQGNDYFSDKVSRLKWKDLEVVYLEDNRFPTYAMAIYFGDGALGDGKDKGSIEAALDYMTLGTRRYSQQEIADNLEFFGVSMGSEVTHEYSSYHVTGLVKDLVPTVQKVCHLFKDATYPAGELKKEKKRVVSALQNSAQNPGFLASRAFREISMSGTPYSYPTSGKLRDVKKWNSKMLKNKLNYLNNEVKKRIYLTGPKSVLNIQKMINEECGWEGKATFVRSVENPERKPLKQPRITLVSVKKANQAQVRIGRYLSGPALKDMELMSLASNFLGSGFTSQLMQVLRVQNGLVYSVGSFAGGQKQYGRSGIITATNVETLGKLLNKTKETLDKVGAGEINDQQFALSKGALAGSFPFGFESSKALLLELMNLDHSDHSYNYLINYTDKVMSFTKQQVAGEVKEIFDWNKQDIVILGPAWLKEELEKLGPVNVVSYEKFL